MTSMDPTTVDTVDADDANEIAAEDQDVTGGYRPMSGESDAPDRESADTETGSMSADTAALGGGAMAGETEGADETGGTGDDFQVGD